MEGQPINYNCAKKMEGQKLNEYLKSKLLSTADVQFNIIDWVLKRDYANMDYGKLEREIITLWSKYTTRQQQFAYLCALGVALRTYHGDLTPSHELYKRLKSLGADLIVCDILPSLGGLVADYPKIAYLNLTLKEFLEKKISIMSFFGDHVHGELHKFWQTIERESNDVDEDQLKSVASKDIEKILTKLTIELNDELQQPQQASLKELIRHEVIATLKPVLHELLEGQLLDELKQELKLKVLERVE